MLAYVGWVFFLAFVESLVSAWAVMIVIGVVHAQLLPSVNPVGFNVAWGIFLVLEVAKLSSTLLKAASGLED